MFSEQHSDEKIAISFLIVGARLIPYIFALLLMILTQHEDSDQ